MTLAHFVLLQYITDFFIHRTRRSTEAAARSDILKAFCRNFITYFLTYLSITGYKIRLTELLGTFYPVSTEMGDLVGFNSRCRTFISVCNQPATQGQLSLPSLRGR